MPLLPHVEQLVDVPRLGHDPRQICEKPRREPLFHANDTPQRQLLTRVERQIALDRVLPNWQTRVFRLLHVRADAIPAVDIAHVGQQLLDLKGRVTRPSAGA